MTKIRVTKMFPFEMAHALWNYDGPCRNIHGHSYKLFVTLIGTPVKDAENPKHGMVIDFGDIKAIVNEHVIEEFDHALVISDTAYSNFRELNNQMFSKLKVVDYQPTVENLLINFARLIKEHLPKKLKLHSLKLQETETACAEWFAEDNR